MGSAPSVVTALVDTIIGKSVPSRRTPVISTSFRCASGCDSSLQPSRKVQRASCSVAGTSTEAGRPTISSADQPNIPSAAALSDSIEPSRANVRIPSAAFSTTARKCAALRCASSLARAARRVCSASCSSACSLYSPIAPAMRIAMPNTNAPRKPIVCACESLRNDGIQPSSTISWPTAQPASDQPSAARHALAPDCWRSASAENANAIPSAGTPATQVDDRRHRGDVHRDPDVELERAGLGVSPPFEEPAQRLGHEDHGRVRPGRHGGDEPEVPQHQQQHEGDRPHHVRQERRRQVGRGGSFARAHARARSRARRPGPRPTAPLPGQLLWRSLDEDRHFREPAVVTFGRSPGPGPGRGRTGRPARVSGRRGDPLVEVVGEVEQRGAAVTGEGGAVHERQGRDVEIGQPAHGRAAGGGERRARGRCPRPRWPARRCRSRSTPRTSPSG